MPEPQDSYDPTFERKVREALVTPIWHDGKLKHLSLQGARVAVAVPMYWKYAAYVSPEMFIAAHQRLSDDMLTVNWRLHSLYGPNLGLPTPDDDGLEVDARGYEYAPPDQPRHAIYLDPAREAQLVKEAEAEEEPVSLAPAPWDDSLAAARASERAAREWSDSLGIPRHRKDRPSQLPAGRHTRYVRQKAAEWNVTDRVADSRIAKHPTGCPFQKPKDPQ
jgi:hypothetical protein